MTAICGGGTSSPKITTAGLTDFSVAYLATQIAEYGAGWAAGAIGLLSLAPLALSTFCASDPPNIPTFTAPEATALTNLSLDANFFSGLNKLADLVHHLAWYDVCQCATGSTVTPLPPAPLPPFGSTTTYIPPTTSTACASYHVTSPGLLVTAGPDTRFGTFDTTAASPTLLSLSLTNIDVGVGCFGMVVGLTACADAAATVCLPEVKYGPFSLTIARSYQPISGYPYLNWSVACTGGGSGGMQADVQADAYCGGGAPGAPAPTCTPDPLSSAKLDAILGLVTLIQRQAVPFATVSGTVHAGLSGNGQFAVHGLVGLSVVVTTLPPRSGAVLGDPDTIYSVGWVRYGTASGWGPRIFIDAASRIIEPILGDVTLVGYSIPTDTVVSITELVREP